MPRRQRRLADDVWGIQASCLVAPVADGFAEEKVHDTADLAGRPRAPPKNNWFGSQIISLPVMIRCAGEMK